MATKCKLCQRHIDQPAYRTQCECGWVMDIFCEKNHHSWCPKHGEDRWVGAVET